MVYESDFYTTRRPYTSRMYPSVTSYSYTYPDGSSSSAMTTTTTTRQYRIVPTTPHLSKIHVIKSLGDNSMFSTSSSLLPYTSGTSRTTTYILPASTYNLIRVRPAIIRKQICRIPRPIILNNDPITNFEDETRLIRSQAMSLMRQLNTPIPRQIRVFLPDKLYLDRSLANDYIFNMLSPIRRLITNYDYRRPMIMPTSVPVTTVPIPMYHFLTLPKPITLGSNAHRFAGVNFVGDKIHSRRKPMMITNTECPANLFNTIRNEVNLLSYYINPSNVAKSNNNASLLSDNRNDNVDEKGQLSPSRPSRHFTALKALEFDDPSDDLKEIRKERAARMAKLADNSSGDSTSECARREKPPRRESQSQLPNKLLSDEKVCSQQPMKCDEDVEETVAESEVVEQEPEQEPEPEPKAEPEPEPELVEEKKPLKKKRRSKTAEEIMPEQQQEPVKKKSSSKIEKIDQKEIDRLEELAREAEADREADLARQAEELAELARQEQELAELERQEQELAEKAALAEQERERKRKEKKEAELAELKRQEEELAELERQEQELAELERQEAELAAAAATSAASAASAEDETPGTPDQQTDAEDLAEDEAADDTVATAAATASADIAEVDDTETNNLSKNHVEIVTTTKTASATSSSDNNECELIDNETMMMMDKDNEQLDTSTNLKETEMQDSVEKNSADADDDDDVTMNTEELQREEDEIVALAKKAVRLAALEAEAKALDGDGDGDGDIVANESDVESTVVAGNEEILA